MQTKTIVITGASDGIGAAAAQRLKLDGHQVVVVGRSPQKTHAIASEISAQSFVADFADLRQVRALASSLRANFPVIDVLANNAGGIFGTRDKTVDGFEITFSLPGNYRDASVIRGFLPLLFILERWQLTFRLTHRAGFALPITRR